MTTLSPVEAFRKHVLQPAEPGATISHEYGRFEFRYKNKATAETAAKIVGQILRGDCISLSEDPATGFHVLKLERCRWMVDDIIRFYMHRKDGEEVVHDMLRAKFSDYKTLGMASRVERMPISGTEWRNVATVYVACGDTEVAKDFSFQLNSCIASGLVKLSPFEKECQTRVANYAPVQSYGEYVVIRGLDAMPGPNGGILADLERLGCAGIKGFREHLLALNAKGALSEHVGVSFGRDAAVAVGAATADPKAQIAKDLGGTAAQVKS